MSDARILYLVRHGETTGGSSVRFYGSTDIPLSDLGREQIRKAKKLLDPRPIRRVFRSEMLRVRQSTEILLEGRELQPIAHRPFNEVSFGQLEGLTEDEIRAKFPAYWQSWRVEKNATDYPGGETFEGFRRRVVVGALDLEARHGWEGENLIVAHRGVIRHLLAHFLAMDPQEARQHAPELGELIVLEGRDGSWAIKGRYT